MSVSSVRTSTANFATSTANLARKHSRVSLVAAGAAAAGMIAAGTASAGVAPWSQAAGNVAKTAQSDGSLASGQSNAAAFNVSGILKAASHNLTSVAPTGAAPAVDGHGTQLTDLQSGSTAASATGTPHAATHQVAKPATVVAQVKHTAPKPAMRPKAPAPAQPFLFYDSVTPSSLPAGQVGAVYANGSYAASASQVDGHAAPILWIDTNGTDTHANVLDVEPGDATPAGAAQWVDAKMTNQPNATAIVYTMLSDWGQVKADIGGLPTWMQSHVQYWIADPTGYPHIVPGSSATQWYWGSSTDESSALGTFGH